jgi:hypothetical protein
MTVAYMLQFLDKTALGYTTIFGIRESLVIMPAHDMSRRLLTRKQNLVGDQYSWAASAFYFGFMVASYPVSLCFVKLPIGKFLSLTLYVGMQTGHSLFQTLL